MLFKYLITNHLYIWLNLYSFLQILVHLQSFLFFFTRNLVLHLLFLFLFSRSHRFLWFKMSKQVSKHYWFNNTSNQWWIILIVKMINMKSWMKSFKNLAPSSTLRSGPSNTPLYPFRSPQISWTWANISKKHSYFITLLLRKLKRTHIAYKLKMFCDILRGKEIIIGITDLSNSMHTLLNILLSCMRMILLVKSSITSLSLSRIADYLHKESIT